MLYQVFIKIQLLKMIPIRYSQYTITIFTHGVTLSVGHLKSLQKDY